MKIKLLPFEETDTYSPIPAFFGAEVKAWSDPTDESIWEFEVGPDTYGWPKSASVVVSGRIKYFSTKQLLKELERRTKGD